MRIFVAFFFVILACTEGFACTCMGPSHAKTMREYAEWYINQPDVALIFQGKVIKQELKSGSIGGPTTAMSMSGVGRFRTVDFAVTRVFRGHHEDQISVVTGMGGGDCGYNFQTGRIYLVYASIGPGAKWFTSICSGTNAVEDAGTALRFLTGQEPPPEDLLPPKEYWKQYYEKVIPKRTGSVCGAVLKPDGTPLKGAIVEAWELRDDDLPSRSASDPNTSTDS